jgi:hypothetical protein
MSGWKLIGADNPPDELVRLHHYAYIRHQAEGKVVFRITVREHANPQKMAMDFYAETDKQTNQHTAPYTPCGWGTSLETALDQCITAIRRFPYEGTEYER